MDVELGNEKTQMASEEPGLVGTSLWTSSGLQLLVHTLQLPFHNLELNPCQFIRLLSQICEVTGTDPSTLGSLSNYTDSHPYPGLVLCMTHPASVTCWPGVMGLG